MTHTLLKAAILPLVLAIAANAAAQPDPAPTILISRQLASAANLGVNDTIVLSADPDGTNGRRFRIVGTYEPTPDPMRLAVQRLEARLHLSDLMTLGAELRDQLGVAPMWAATAP
jgi:hypothetical protein